MKPDLEPPAAPQRAGTPMKDLIARLTPLNRALVTADNRRCLELLGERLPLKAHEYPSGGEHATWVVPPQWDVVEAYLSDGETVIASYAEHPMFLAGYSVAFEGWVSREELLKRVRTSEKRPKDFIYEHRLASNYKLRLKDWAISVPYERVRRLDKDRYYVKIDVKTGPGHLIVGESMLRGREDKTFALLAHTCHTGQSNDGIAGVVVGAEIMRRLGKGPQRRFNYQLLVMPETTGSAIYLANNLHRIDEYLASLFLEMPGAGQRLAFNHSRLTRIYWDRLLGYVVKRADPSFREYAFHRGMGNDELNFDWPAIGIPGLAVYWDEFPEYHTSADAPELIDEAKLETVVRTVLEMIDILEADYIPSFTQRVPVYQSRYDLYVDAFKQKELYHAVTDVLFAIDGRKTLFEIVEPLGASFHETAAYLEKWVEAGFLSKKPVPVERYREVQP